MAACAHIDVRMTATADAHAIPQRSGTRRGDRTVLWDVLDEAVAVTLYSMVIDGGIGTVYRSAYAVETFDRTWLDEHDGARMPRTGCHDC